MKKRERKIRSKKSEQREEVRNMRYKTIIQKSSSAKREEKEEAGEEHENRERNKGKEMEREKKIYSDNSKKKNKH